MARAHADEDAALGIVIRERREACSLHQKDVADRLGMNPVSYGRIELGTRSARASEILHIARILGTTADALLESAQPATVQQVVDYAQTAHDAALASMSEYASARAAALSAMEQKPQAVEVSGRTIKDALSLGASLPLPEELSKHV